LYKHPTEIVHFESTSEAAVMWVEQFLADPDNIKKGKEVKKRSSMLKRAESNISGASAWGRMTSFFGDANMEEQGRNSNTSYYKALYNNMLVFVAGVSIGILVATKKVK
jgi:hypothetical protein